MRRDTVSIPGRRAVASRIRALVLDVDGVLTDGRLHVGPHGEMLKTFNVKDGLGLKLLMAAGYHVAVITARESLMVRNRMEELGIEEVMMGRRDKKLALRTMMLRLDLTPDRVAYMGDDILDLPAMNMAGFSMAPADAHPLVRKRASWTASMPGGGGAVREACDELLSATCNLESFIEEYLLGLDGHETMERARSA